MPFAHAHEAAQGPARVQLADQLRLAAQAVAHVRDGRSLTEALQAPMGQGSRGEARGGAGAGRHGWDARGADRRRARDGVEGGPGPGPGAVSDGGHSAALRGGALAIASHALRHLASAQEALGALMDRRPREPLDSLLTCAVALMSAPMAGQGARAFDRSDAGEAAASGASPAPVANATADAADRRGSEAMPRAYADATVVDQTVIAARRIAAPTASFANAVLRRYLREREALAARALERPVTRWEHPAWWIARLERDWPALASQLLAANQQRPPMALRVNARRTTPGAYAARLAGEGIAARTIPVPHGAPALVLDAPVPVWRLPDFEQGEVSVQDVNAQRAAPLLMSGRPQRHPDGRPWRILDACAAPGGKTAHLLEIADAQVLALDSDAQRVERLHGTLERLGLQAQAQVHVGDAADPSTWWNGEPFDAILLDAPCSGSGVVRRHPDIRWLRRAADIAPLAALQSRMLDALWPLLAPGGRLLYATCSVFREEGEQQIDAFVQRIGRDRIRVDPASPGHCLPLADNPATDAAEALPGPADGFYLALLHRVDPS